MKRDGLIIHDSTILGCEQLQDEELAALIKAIFEYHMKGAQPDFSDRALRIVFSDFKRRYDDDTLRYFNTCERNRNNAIIRWSKRPHTTAYDRIQSDATDADVMRTEEMRTEEMRRDEEAFKNVF